MVYGIRSTNRAHSHLRGEEKPITGGDKTNHLW